MTMYQLKHAIGDYLGLQGRQYPSENELRFYTHTGCCVVVVDLERCKDGFAVKHVRGLFSVGGCHPGQQLATFEKAALQ